MLQASAAREVVADEAATAIDAMARDALWKGADSLTDAMPRPLLPPLPPLPLPLLLPLPPLQGVVEALAPRLDEQERLLLLRLPIALAQLSEAEADAGESRDADARAGASSAGAGGAEVRAEAAAGRLLEGMAVIEVARLPEVRDGVQWLLQRALVERDADARATVDRVASGLRTRLRSRLRHAGVEEGLADAASDAAVRTPW